MDARQQDRLSTTATKTNSSKREKVREMSQASEVAQQSDIPNSYAAWDKAVANGPGLERGETMSLYDLKLNEDGSATYTKIAQTFTPRQYVKDVRWIVSGRCRAAVSRPRSRGAGRPAARRTTTRSSAASGDPDQPDAAIAAPKLPQLAMAAAAHPPAAFTSFNAGAATPCPSRPIAARAAAGGER
jgi:hypothetical protein